MQSLRGALVTAAALCAALCVALCLGACFGRGGFEGVPGADDGPLPPGDEDQLPDEDPCLPHASVLCISGHMVFVNSCGTPEDRAEDCRVRGCSDFGCNAPGPIDVSAVRLENGAANLRVSMAPDSSYVIAYTTSGGPIVQQRTAAGWRELTPTIVTGTIWDWAVAALATDSVVVAEQRVKQTVVARFNGESWSQLGPALPSLEAIGAITIRNPNIVAVQLAHHANGVVSLSRALDEIGENDGTNVAQIDTISLTQYDPATNTWGNTHPATTLNANPSPTRIITNAGLAIAALTDALVVEGRQGEVTFRTFAGTQQGFLQYNENVVDAQNSLARTSDNRLYYAQSTGAGVQIAEHVSVQPGVTSPASSWTQIPRPINTAVQGVAVDTHEDLPVVAYAQGNVIRLIKWDGDSWEPYLITGTMGTNAFRPKLVSSADLICLAWEPTSGGAPGLWCYAY